MGLLAIGLLLSGCSGLGHFFGDTETLPGQNPNATLGSSETLLRSRGQDPAATPIVAEPGNVWPGPPQPLPTLSDVARTGGELNGGIGGAGASTLKSGASISLGEQQAVHNGAPLDDTGFSGGGGRGGLAASVPDPAAGFRQQHAAPPSASGDIVIPNGDGTSTVISPDGSVKTVKGTPK